ncbi:uncharacterized protein LOC108136165 [Drosophila elegans]|uniref:uncharacterized protein LOC108136165 n=1 Tax=Drosophila elegans TaxID=30023 RepID=UPI0007E6EF2D|nr:uncharacterized protein LOC108136165 [Drosophila elegans]
MNSSFDPFARPVRMPVGEAQKGRGRKATASVSAAAAARRQSALSEEEDEAGHAEPMDQDQDENNRDDPDFDEGEEEEEQIDEEDEDEEPDSNETSDPEEQVEPPAFSLATLGLQRVGSAPPPKPKVQKAPILTLNARGMPARIRKRNRLFYDENIINDDKPLRMSLAPKKMPGRPPLSAGGGGGGSAQKSNPPTPSKVLKKRKGVVSRYMRTNNEQGSSSNSASSQQAQQQQVGKHKKTPSKGQGSASKLTAGGLKPARGAHLVGKGAAAAAAAAAAAEEEATQAEATALANKRLGQSIGLRLRNLLKLPKAHKWAIAEWFYSYIDKPLFDCRDEFMNHVNELAPRLGTRSLNRHEWVNIRRRMGRPRRCSANFFSEERKELDRKRQLMRTLQSRKPGEFKDSMLLSDMPEKIPMPLPLGTKVTARLRTPQDGIFAGTVAAYDSMNSMYRVTFERPGLGTHAIPDYEIVSENFHEMLPLHSFTKDFRPNLMSIYQTNNQGFTTNLGYTANLTSHYLQKKEKGGGVAGSRPQKHLASNNAAARNALSMKLNKSDPLLGQDSVGESPIRQQLARHHAYPSTLLEHLVHLEKHIAVKADRIQRLNKMNATAELAMGEMISQDENGDRHRRQIADNFQRQYAFNIVSIERINAELMFELTKVQEMSSSLTRNPNVQAMISPTYLREECRAKASQTVDDINKGMVKNPRMIRLIKNLTTLLIVTQNLGGDCEVSEVNKVLEGCLEEVRSNLFSDDNSEVFQKSVQVRLEYIARDISRSLEERSASRMAADDVKSPLKSEEEDMDEDRGVQEQEGAASKTKTKGRPKELLEKKEQSAESASKKGGQKEHHMDMEAEAETDKLDSDESDQQHLETEEEHLETEEQHLEPEEEQSPNPAATEDTQITIESMKESDDEFQSIAETEEEDEMVGLEPLKMEGDDGDEEFVYLK